MSTLKTNNIEHLDATSPSIVVNAAGGIQVGGALTATTGTFSGNVSVAGVLSYEDVANIDSVGIITAQSGINVTGGNVDVGNILADIGGVRTNIDGSVVINPASSLSSTAQRFILYKDRSANTDMAVVFTKAGRADFAGRLYTSEWFQADRTDGTNSAFYATVSGTEKLNIRANGSASFAAGAFAIESDGDISTNVKCHGHIELDSTGAFTSPKIKLFSNTGNATFLGNVFVGKIADVFADVGIRFPSYGAGEFTRNQGALLALNRLTTDGDLIDFYRNGVSQGNIRVNSGTVSLNGAHLSRWSQLPGGADRTEILRGSILSNLDEMCEWGEEDNEQLNRMKVSDVEGDRNISGVFESWDDEDDTYTNDFYCAMTGDFVIRIAQGTTVARGDLLMSAGDGTSKPQDDDIIRSKTIAKVTSTNVSETYADGSYCVPCVLMAC